jgi:Domain of Unknown Function (DUF1080)
MGMAAVILAAFVIDAVVDDRVIPGPLGQVSIPDETPTPESTILSDDLSDWDLTGSGKLVATDHAGGSVWTARGDGFVTWRQPIVDMVLDVGFRFPEGPVDAGVVVRIPGSDVDAGVEISLDAAGEGSVRIGHIEDLAAPVVYSDARPGEWHALRVTVSDERVIVHVDDRHIADWVDLGTGEGRMAAEGDVALRFSDGIEFRGVELAETSQVSEIE